MKRVGILAIQGDVDAHAQAVEHLGAHPFPVLSEKDLDAADCLILPGGESTTVSKGLERLRLYEPLRAYGEAGRPILGTCAGAILLARSSANHPVQTLGLLDLVALRNAYGTQVDSFAAGADATPGESDSCRQSEGLRCVFIRAPRFEQLGDRVEVQARVDGVPVWVREGSLIACSFHPELTDDGRVHAQLLNLVVPG